MSAVRQYALTHAEWLELRYRVFQPEYDQLVELAGFAPGWRVLDVGCGSGAHANVLRRVVSGAGTVVGCDVGADNVASARSRIGPAGYDDVVEADALALPFENRAFDAVWCANVLQYLSDDEASRALDEMRRVVRPGGRIAVKDVDMLLWRVHPLDPLLLPRLLEAGVAQPESRNESLAAMRGRTLKHWLQRAGLEHVRQHVTLLEREAPLSGEEAAMYQAWLHFLSGIAEQRRISDADIQAWRAAAGDARPRVADASDFYACEGQVLATGTVV